MNKAEAKRAEDEMQAYLNQSSQAKAEPQVEPDSGNNERAKTEQAKSEQNAIDGVNVPSMLPKE